MAQYEPLDEFDKIADAVLKEMGYEITTACPLIRDSKGRDDSNRISGMTEAKLAQALAKAARLGRIYQDGNVA